jgi:excinuclease ABC subunit C
MRGPAAFSTLGMRIQNEQSRSSSLFAQPIAIEAVPEEENLESEKAREQASQEMARPPAKLQRGLLESRLETALAELASPAAPPSATVRQGHLALLKRWYYRPEARRAGEIFFPDAEDRWPVKAILRGIGRVATKGLPSAP